MLQRVVFPIGDVLRGRSLAKVMGELRQTQWRSRDHLIRLQAQRLSALISHAYLHVPYYRDVMRARNLVPEDIRNPSDLIKLPLLTREELRSNYPQRLCCAHTCRRKIKEGRTGGSSTGEPLFFGVDLKSLDYGRAAFYRAMSWAGCPPGTRTLILWGQPVGKAGFQAAFTRKVMRVLFRNFWIDAFAISDDFLRKAAEMLRGKVQFMYGYVSALQELCRYIKTAGMRVQGVQAVMTTAEVLLPEVRSVLEDTFQAPIFDGYACGEVNGIAYECNQHQGLHLAMERAVVEIVNMEGEPVAEGTPGRLAITDLHNFTMPLVRYVTGDEAQVRTDPCACGRNLDRLENILGRTCDIVDGVNGRHVHSYYFASLFGSLGWAQTHGLTRFQIVQESQSDLRITLAIRNRPCRTEEEQMLSRLCESLGPMRFRIEYCDGIETTHNGKYRWTINLTRAPKPTKYDREGKKSFASIS